VKVGIADNMPLVRRVLLGGEPGNAPDAPPAPPASAARTAPAPDGVCAPVAATVELSKRALCVLALGWLLVLLWTLFLLLTPPPPQLEELVSTATAQPLSLSVMTELDRRAPLDRAIQGLRTQVHSAVCGK
jgi:hypothetical protein